MIQAKVIKTHSAFKPGAFRQAIHAEALTVMAGMMRDFNATTRTWEHNVDFKGTVQDTREGVRVTIGTKDKIYAYVDQGTRPHIIRPRNAKALAFASKYHAKTTVRVIGSHKGGASGKTVYAQEVHHPGTDAREFSHTIQARWQPRLARHIEQAIQKAARQSGHSISK